MKQNRPRSTPPSRASQGSRASSRSRMSISRMNEIQDETVFQRKPGEGVCRATIDHEIATGTFQPRRNWMGLLSSCGTRTYGNALNLAEQPNEDRVQNYKQACAEFDHLPEDMNRSLQSRSKLWPIVRYGFPDRRTYPEKPEWLYDPEKGVKLNGLADASNRGKQVVSAGGQRAGLRAKLRPHTAQSMASAASSRMSRSTAAPKRPRSGVVKRADADEAPAMTPLRRPSSQLSNLASPLNTRHKEPEISDAAAQTFSAKYGVSPEAFATRYALDRLRVQSASGVHEGSLRVAEKVMLGFKNYHKISEPWLCDGGLLYAFGESGREPPSLIASRLHGQEQRIQFDMLTQVPRVQDGELVLKPLPRLHGEEALHQLREELQNQTRKSRLGSSTGPRDGGEKDEMDE